MSPHHAAALALVGWYLMYPPRVGSDFSTFDVRAPISQWSYNPKFDTFSSEADCDQELQNRKGVAEADLRRGHGFPVSIEICAPCITPSDPRPIGVYVNIQTARCIAPDDPRLKVK